MSGLSGKAAIVTGGASGMGRIIALRLASRGTQVAIFDVNEEGLASTAAESPNLHPFRCDIASPDDIADKVAAVEEALGPLDLLVHCAALMPSHKLVDESHASMERLFSINYLGTVAMVQAVLPGMLERNAGRIIAFGSIAGHAHVPKMGAYCATKSAVNTYMEVLQNELRDSAVKLHVVKPPAVNTPLVDQTLATDTPGSIVEAKKSGRLADPEKVVDALEKGVAKERNIIYPGEARLLLLWSTLFPKLWWKTVMSFEN